MYINILHSNFMTILCKRLLSCITQVPFYDHHTNIYTQIDNIVIGATFSPILLYTVHLENKMFNNFQKPMIYAQYNYDTFILPKTLNEIKKILNNNIKILRNIPLRKILF